MNGSQLVMVSTNTILKIHEYLTREFEISENPVSPPGIRSMNLLESAVSRQQTSLGGVLKYPTVHSNAASLMYGVCNNHPFFNGNKRTALLSGLLHLDLNGYLLNGASNDQLYETMRRLAAHEPLAGVGYSPKINIRYTPDIEISELARWLHDKSRKTIKGERSISYGRLYEILESFGYRLGDKRGNKVEVLKSYKFFGVSGWRRVYKVSCPGDSRTISLNEIKQVREALRLTEENGVDSHSFYSEQTLIDEHIRNSRSVLRRLAKI